MEATCFSETSVDFRRSARRENLKFYNIKVIYRVKSVEQFHEIFSQNF
jgi:hypothetical protein